MCGFTADEITVFGNAVGRRDRIYEKKDISMSRLRKGFRRFAAAALCAVLALSAAG